MFLHVSEAVVTNKEPSYPEKWQKPNIKQIHGTLKTSNSEYSIPVGFKHIFQLICAMLF